MEKWNNRDFPTAPMALVVAHPGHELRVWSWLERLRPLVLVVTDGGGRAGTPRVDTTERLIREVGATRGPVFGDWSDRQLYQAVLSQEVGRFQRLAERIANALTSHRIRTVVGDAAEGIIMAHDLLREVRRAAVAIAEQQLGWSIAQFEFPLDSHPATCPREMQDRRCELRLTDASLARKLDVARRYGELASLVQLQLESYGIDAFASENLFPCTDRSLLDDLAQPTESPRYETHGEEQVRLGHYAHVIRQRLHVQPLIDAVHSLAECVV